MFKSSFIFFRFPKSLLLFSVVCSATVADAGTLIVDGQPDFQISLLEGEVRVEGAYTLVNRGDERVVEAFPSMSIGAWSWAGERTDLDKGASFTWEFKGVFPIADLGCSGSSLCLGNTLPEIGAVPVLLRRYYQDTNHYEFSAGDVITKNVGQLNDKQLALIREPSIQLKLAFHGDGQDFQGVAILRNYNAEPKKVFLGLHSAREIEIDGEPQLVDVPGKQVVHVKVSVKNFNAINGSGYPVFAVAQWEEAGARIVVKAIDKLMITERDNTMLMISLGKWVMIGSLCFLFGVYVVMRFLRPKKQAVSAEG